MAAMSWCLRSGSRRCNQRTVDWPLPAIVVVVVALTTGPCARADVSEVLTPVADTTAMNTSETATASAAIAWQALPAPPPGRGRLPGRSHEKARATGPG